MQYPAHPDRAAVRPRNWLSVVSVAPPPLQSLAVKKNFFVVQILGGEKLLLKFFENRLWANGVVGKWGRTDLTGF